MARRTPLYEAHREAGGRLVDFAGWELPVQYRSVIAEHEKVRNAVGLFDVSHMGEIELRGAGALEAANGVISNDLARIEDGQALYSGLLNDEGTFVDDVVVYRFSPARILFCVNAANREKDFAWMRERVVGVTPVDRGDDFAQLALQGPKARDVLARLTPLALGDLGFYRFAEGDVAGVQCIVSRTGYTGEDGFELYCPPERAMALWAALLEAGAPEGIEPAGLGARDTLRTEMRFPLYGQDIDDRHTPLEAAMGWTVKLDKGDFVGKAALARQKAEGVQRKLVGFVVDGAQIPRPGYRILKDGEAVGEVTSGTKGPSVGRPIGIGYVPTALSTVDSTFEIDVRGRPVPATVVKTPFWRRPG